MYTDDNENRIYEGEVIEIGNEAEEANINNGTIDVIPIKISINDDDTSLLRSGFSINIDIIVANESNVTAVPTTSIITDNTGSYVFVVENEVLVKTPVATGVSNDSMTEVSGINEGVEVVTTGSILYTDGMSVNDIQQSENAGGNEEAPMEMQTFSMTPAAGGGSMPSGGGPRGGF
ncbi:MAG: efflux RND transporter periplasmic adaptor subunit, partial [Lachnospirales bacterium]